MNRSQYISIIALAAVLLMPVATHAQDTTLNRNVTVERDFQPIIHSAGIVSVKPTIVQQEMAPVEVTYSSFSQSLSPAFNINPLECSLTTWNTPKPLHGYVRGGLGHTNTVFDFGYRLEDKKAKIAFDAFAHHRAAWGRYTVEKSTFGFNIDKMFSSAALYFGADAENRYYTFSARYIDSTITGNINEHLPKPKDLKPEDKIKLWAANTRIGLRSTGNSTFRYNIQTGYSAFLFNKSVVEHQIRSIATLEWNSKPHRAGVNVSAANLFMDVKDGSIPDSLYNSRHAIRIEPYYAYDAKRFHVHLGVNLDVNIGKGQMLSTMENVAFAPSPNVSLEYDITQNWLAIYAKASGSLGEGSLQSHAYTFPYRTFESGVVSSHVPSYIPVQAQLGLKLRPQANLLFDIHARYEMKRNQFSTANPYYWEVRQYRENQNLDKNVFGDYVYCNLQRWKIGAEITYHYQDIINIFIGGGFYTGSMDSIEVPTASKNKPTDIASFDKAVRNDDGSFKMLDRPRWDLTLNIDARIDRHWSLYSHNYFAGKRLALMWDETYDASLVNAATGDDGVRRTYSLTTFIPTIELNLGCMYEYNKWLSVFLELNNIIHRHNVYYYGFTNPGVNFVLGASYRF